MQSVLVAGLEFGATNRTVLLMDLARDVLVLVTTFFAAKDAGQHSQRCATVLTLGSASGFQSKVCLVPLHRFETRTSAVLVIDGALRKKSGTLRTLHLLWCPTHVVLDAPRPSGFVIAFLVAVLGVAVLVVEHAFTLGTAFHCSLPVFTAYIFGCAFHAAVPVSLIARCKLFPAPSAGLWKVDSILFTGQGDPFADRNDRLCYRIPRVAVSAFCSYRNQDNTSVLNRDMSR